MTLGSKEAHDFLLATSIVSKQNTRAHLCRTRTFPVGSLCRRRVVIPFGWLTLRLNRTS